METTVKTIWVLTNESGYFVRACETREKALAEMKAWRDNFEKAGLFPEVSKIDAVYYSQITFKVTDRDGKTREMAARETTLN